MFCFKCGHQLPDDAQFCVRCGTALHGKSAMTVNNSPSMSGELDREAIKIYLSNILALECMKVKLSEDYDATEAELTYEQNNNYVQRFSIPNGYLWLAYHDGIYHIGAFRDDGDGAYTGEYLNREGMLDGDGFVKYVWGQGVVEHGGEFYWGRIDDDSFPIIKKPSFWWDIGGSNVLQQKLWQINARDAFLRIYADFQKVAPKKHHENLLRTIRPLEEKVNGIEQEYQKADTLLQRAYDINIIPRQFRNIHAIWFIHDFVVSSNETLSSAFLQCNLDEIKEKLDTIIEQNDRLIIQNAVQIAQNSQMMEQNQKMLQRLANIENNTDRAAQYAQIAANNAEACAWIGLANYIKD